MSLNPSCNLREGLKSFPRLGDPPFRAESKDIAVAELRAAGFPRGSESIIMREMEVFCEGSEAAKLARSGIHIPARTRVASSTVRFKCPCGRLSATITTDRRESAEEVATLMMRKHLRFASCDKCGDAGVMHIAVDDGTTKCVAGNCKCKKFKHGKKRGRSW